MIRVSAPGKAILMGEHAAVYGRPALVAALDRRVHVCIDPIWTAAAGQVLLDLPAVGVQETATWQDLRASVEQPGLDSPVGSRFVRAAFGEALVAADFAPDRGAHIRIHSEFPVGSGFGSSAAIAVAVVRAVFQLAGREIDADTLQAVSLEIEKRQHGSPSGIDNATVIHGGVVWVERRGGRLHVESLETTSDSFDTLRVYQTGQPAESTGEVVTSVRARRERDAAAFEARLEIMEASTRRFRHLLEARSGDGLAAAIHEFRRFESCLEAWGVVPEPVRRVVRQVEALGGAAKISGAGSLAGPGAGSLLVLHPDPATLDTAGILDVYERLDLRLGGEGVRVDET